MIPTHPVYINYIVYTKHYKQTDKIHATKKLFQCNLGYHILIQNAQKEPYGFAIYNTTISIYRKTKRQLVFFPNQNKEPLYPFLTN